MAETFADCQEELGDNRPAFLSLLETHISIDEAIPIFSRNHLYISTGRTRKYSLQALLWALIIQRIFSIPTDQLLLIFLACSKPLRDLCGFDETPDVSKITRFRQDSLDDLQFVFRYLVDLTEPICQTIDSAKTDMTIFDSSETEVFVIGDDPKYASRTIKRLKAYAKSKGYGKSYNPYKAAYGAMPSHTFTNPEIERLYINGHLCYVLKPDIVTNGFRVICRISFYNKDFMISHLDTVVEKRTDSPDEDKPVYDSKLLAPALKDFFAKHPLINPEVFLGDTAFDSVQLYKELLSGDTFDIDEHFSKACILLNSRSHLENIGYTISDNGIPCCPHDPSLLMEPKGNTSRLCCGSPTFEFICPRMKYIKCEDGKYHRRCQCGNLCTTSPREGIIYIHPEEDLCVFPGTTRDTKE